MLLGAQTFTIREHTQSEADFSASMKRLSGIGYTSVQLSAIGSFQPSFLKSVCDDHGLRIVLTHTAPERILRAPEKVIEDHQILNCPYVGIGMLPQAYRSSDSIAQFVADYQKPAQLLLQAGLKLMYHHHNFEWEKLPSGMSILETILAGFPKNSLGITLDTYWVQAAGADVCDTILWLKDRIHCVHLKDMAVKGFDQRMAPIGEGNLPFEKILHLLAELGTTEFVLVEQDQCYGEDPFDCLARSYHYLKERGIQ